MKQHNPIKEEISVITNVKYVKFNFFLVYIKLWKKKKYKYNFTIEF